MKFRGNEGYTIRSRWITKGLKNIQWNPRIFTEDTGSKWDAFGTNLSIVRSIRFYLKAFGLVDDVRGSLIMTELGQMIWDHDPYLEEDGTLQILQYKLATNKDLATSFWYFFNVFNMNQFTREELIKSMHSVYPAVPLKNIEDDARCTIGSYLTDNRKRSPEDERQCPLIELGMIKEMDKSLYIKKPAMDLKNEIALAVLHDFFGVRTELSLSDLYAGENGIGKVFNLDTMDLMNILHGNDIRKEFKFVRTAGLDVVVCQCHRTFNECVKEFYENIESGESGAWD